MRLTADESQSDRRKMKAYIARLLPEEGTRVVLFGDGEGDEVWVDLDPVRYDDGEWDLHWKTNEPEYVDLQLIYDHFRRQEMTVEERRREQATGRCDGAITQKAITRPAPDGQRLETDSAELAALREMIAQRFSNLEKMLALSRVKETYTAEEVAAQLKKSPWVVRQWCNKDQVPGAYKIQTGRGKKGEWRIPHDAVIRLQNEGPLLLAV